MNATPHTHKLNLEESTGGWTAIRVQYGDQPRHYVYTCWPGWRSRIRRVVKRLVRHHDRQSIKAGRRSNTAQQFTKDLALHERSGTWGRDVLSGTPLPPVEVTLTHHEASKCWVLTGPFPHPHYFQYKDSAMACVAANGYILTKEATPQ